MKWLITFLLVFLPVIISAEDLRHLDYGYYQLFFDCDRHGAKYFYYQTVKDTGNYDSRPSFKFDERLPVRCRQFSSSTYQKEGEKYHLGHLVPANHFDSNKAAYESTFYMANVLPQTSTLNTGAWKKTENLIDCFRDVTVLQVWGGPVWGTNETDDYFTGSHGVVTPDYYWKVVFTGNKVIAWKIPNNYQAKSDKINSWLVTVREIEVLTGVEIDMPDRFKDIKPEKTWKYPRGCSVK